MYASQPAGENSLIDLRSDTVTQPGEGMRKAMGEAALGDDVYGDDPSVNALQERAADMLGKEAALFVASGTQSNLTALLSHCGRGDEYIGGIGYHICKYEAGGAAVLGGISPRHLAPNQNGCLDAGEVAANVQPDDPHFAVTRLVCLENTFNGQVVPQDEIESVIAAAHENGLAVHLDGARLMNAAIATGKAPADLVANVDTVSLCLSKGLGAPVGSVLCGPKEFIGKAKRARKLLGGGMRQAGVLAACGLYALDHNIDRLAEDHEHAAELANRLSQVKGVSIALDRVHTNMVWMNLSPSGQRHRDVSFADHMGERGIQIANPSGPDQTVRAVTHLDYDGAHASRIVDAVASWVDA